MPIQKDLLQLVNKALSRQNIADISGARKALSSRGFLLLRASRRAFGIWSSNFSSPILARKVASPRQLSHDPRCAKNGSAAADTSIIQVAVDRAKQRMRSHFLTAVPRGRETKHRADSRRLCLTEPEAWGWLVAFSSEYPKTEDKKRQTKRGSQDSSSCRLRACRLQDASDANLHGASGTARRFAIKAYHRSRA